MGDVALTTPVIRAMREQFRDIEIVILTRQVFSPFFTSIEGVKLFFPEFYKRHKGILGLIRLFNDLKKTGSFDYVIDLHDVLRSKVLRYLFRISGTPVSVIIKGRDEKKLVVEGRRRDYLKHTVERYAGTFHRAGFRVLTGTGKSIVPGNSEIEKVRELLNAQGFLNIGVAPFAMHHLKMWPEENMISLLQMISLRYHSHFWLFGGRSESERLEKIRERVSGSKNIAGKFTLEEELALMSRLDFMISMDSSNMHMAALTGTKVISIWGATDPVTGFGAWQQPDEYTVRIPYTELTCRPCTVYGKGTCRRGDHACMHWMTPAIVFEKIEKSGVLALHRGKMITS
jgi:ADP-heptose:LPS heptosyltransferase